MFKSKYILSPFHTQILYHLRQYLPPSPSRYSSLTFTHNKLALQWVVSSELEMIAREKFTIWFALIEKKKMFLKKRNWKKVNNKDKWYKFKS